MAASDRRRLKRDLHRLRGRAFKDAMNAADPQERDRALETAQAAELGTLALKPHDSFTTAVEARVTKRVADDLEEIYRKYADVQAVGEVALCPDDPDYWTGLRLASSPDPYAAWQDFAEGTAFGGR